MLSSVNSTTVSQAVLNTLHEYQVDFNRVSVFDSDNAAYCLKAVQTLQVLCLNAVHITCLARYEPCRPCLQVPIC